MPFCSARCQQVDLRRWLGEEYSLPLNPEEELEGEEYGDGYDDDR